jgi:hypothetical protein
MRPVLAIAALALVAAACGESGGGGDPSTTTTTTLVEHPMGGNEVVLRVAHEGGFAPIEFSLTNLPAFSLYGDGTVVVPGSQVAIYPGPALPSVQTLRLSEERLQEIIVAAREAGVVAPDRALGHECVMDASTTVFTLTAGGSTATVSVYALGLEGPDAGADPSCGIDEEAARTRATLAAFLESIGSLVYDGTLPPPTDYQPSAMRVFVADEVFHDPDLPQVPLVWPLSTPLADFGVDVAGVGLRCGVVDGEDQADVLALARRANQLTPWVSEGLEFGLTFRPLLPDESGC